MTKLWQVKLTSWFALVCFSVVLLAIVGCIATGRIGLAILLGFCDLGIFYFREKLWNDYYIIEDLEQSFKDNSL